MDWTLKMCFPLLGFCSEGNALEQEMLSMLTVSPGKMGCIIGRKGLQFYQSKNPASNSLSLTLMQIFFLALRFIFYSIVLNLWGKGASRKNNFNLTYSCDCLVLCFSSSMYFESCLSSIAILLSMFFFPEDVLSFLFFYCQFY
ncbi:hypothetical protein ACH5RR_007982 [Cinchona calisaya]|uniref:Uncharacterized protein n=1 Tax=Cinchona calisaya TaxID=153742 RepID=A0ABD3ADZ1_9GENT